MNEVAMHVLKKIETVAPEAWTFARNAVIKMNVATATIAGILLVVSGIISALIARYKIKKDLDFDDNIGLGVIMVISCIVCGFSFLTILFSVHEIIAVDYYTLEMLIDIAK